MPVIKAIIDRLEDDLAVIRLDDGQELSLPLNLLPLGSQEGSVISLSLGDEASLTKERQVQAKALLNEILQIETENQEDAERS